MLHARRHRGIEAVTATAVLTLLVMTCASQYTLFAATDRSVAEGAGGAYSRFEGPSVDDVARGGAAGSGWVTAAIASLAVLALVAAGAWLVRRAVRRRRTAEDINPELSPCTESPASAADLAPATDGDEVLAAWRQVEALTVDGRGVLPASRTTATTARAAVAQGASARTVFELGRLYDRDRYSTQPLDANARAQARELALGLPQKEQNL